MSWKALEPIVVSCVHSARLVIVIFLQPQNIELEILTMSVGRLTVSSDVQPIKVACPIFVASTFSNPSNVNNSLRPVSFLTKNEIFSIPSFRESFFAKAGSEFPNSEAPIRPALHAWQSFSLPLWHRRRQCAAPWLGRTLPEAERGEERLIIFLLHSFFS